MIKTVSESNDLTFEKKCNDLIEMGAKLLSTSCGFVQSEKYDFCNCWQAIFLIKPKRQNIFSKALRFLESCGSAILATGCDGNDVEKYMEKK